MNGLVTFDEALAYMRACDKAKVAGSKLTVSGEAVAQIIERHHNKDDWFRVEVRITNHLPAVTTGTFLGSFPRIKRPKKAGN